MKLIDTWLRRAWRPDEAALQALPGTRPALLVTGGSDGIGRAIAREMSGPGRTTILIARDPGRLEHAATAIAAATGAECLTLPLDVRRTDAPHTIRAFLAAHDLFADILVNSAGVGTTGEFHTEDPDDLDAVTDLNVTALTRLTRAFLPDMLVRGRGGIINVASLGGFLPGPYQAAYYATKAHVISLTRALAWENRGRGVRIATVAPGPVNTEFHARANAESSLYRHVMPAVSPETVARWTRHGFALGQGIIVPGIFATLLSLAVRILPGALTTPAMSLLLRPRHHAAASGTNRPANPQ
jgi:short-subunit dehydrogenase